MSEKPQGAQHTCPTSSCHITPITKSATNHDSWLLHSDFRTLAQRRPKSSNRVDKTWHHVTSLVPPSQLFSANGYLLYSVNDCLLATAARPTSFICPARPACSFPSQLLKVREIQHSIISIAFLIFLTTIKVIV